MMNCVFCMPMPEKYSAAIPTIRRLSSRAASRAEKARTTWPTGFERCGFSAACRARRPCVFGPGETCCPCLVALGEILFEVAQQPFVLVGRALRDAHAHFGLPPFRIVGKARYEHHPVAGRVQVALLDLRSIGRIALGQQFGADVQNLYTELVEHFIDFLRKSARAHHALLFLIPQFGFAFAMEVELLSQTARSDAGVNRSQAVLFRSSFSHQEKDGKSFLSHNS